MTTILARGREFWRAFAGRLSVSRDSGPIDTMAELSRFVRTRAAFVAQHKLYGYLKTRIGTRYPRMFEEAVFVQSVNVAKMHIFAACLSDLTIHAVAKATAGAGFDRAARETIANRFYREGLDENAGEQRNSAEAAEWVAAFEARLADVNWENIAAGGDAFTTSPKALVRWAPIADDLKKYDAEIVRNSVRYAWNEIIRALRLRLDIDAVTADSRNAL